MAKNSSEMSLERFEELLNRFGSELENWPEMDRENAKSFLESSDAAQKLVLIERSINKFLSSQGHPTPPRSLTDRIINKAKKTK